MGPVLTLTALAFGARAFASEEMGGNLYYFGDLHTHTAYSGDAASNDLPPGYCRGTTNCGYFSDVFDDARANGMDFLAIADHINGFRSMTDAQWLTELAAVLAANDPASGFVTIPGAELWVYDTSSGSQTALGHRTLLMWEDDATLAPMTIDEARFNSDTTVSECQELFDWADTMSAAYGQISLIPHHPATLSPSAMDWDCWDGDYAPAVEVYSRHGNSLESDSAWDVPGAGVVSSGYAAAALDPDTYALQFGFVGGTDSHDTRPGETCALDYIQPRHLYGGGLTGVVLDASESFDRMAIYDAIEAHRTYATSGPMVPLEVTWSVDGEELGGLGAALSITNDDALTVTVRLPDTDAPYVNEVLLIAPQSDMTLTFDGVDTWTASVDAGDVPDWLYVRVEIDGAAYYGATTCTDGGSDDLEFLWGSPSFIDMLDEDLDDDGYDDDDGDCDDLDATIYPGAAEIWYDGVDGDCDGASDFDQDGDAFEAITEGGDDCDDEDARVSPARIEDWYDGTDGDCDGWSDFDQDYDGHEALAEGGDDCDDTDDTVQPDAIEVWYDGVDQDCDGWSDFDQDYDGYDALDGGGEDCDDLDDGVCTCETVDLSDSGVVPSVDTGGDAAVNSGEDTAAIDSAANLSWTSEPADTATDSAAPTADTAVVADPVDSGDSAEPCATTDTGTEAEETPAAPTVTVGVGLGGGHPTARGLNLWSRPRIRR